MRPVKPPAALNEHYDRAANADRRIRYRVAGVNISVLVKMLETPLDCDGYDQRHAADERNSDERAGGQVPNIGFRVVGHRGYFQQGTGINADFRKRGRDLDQPGDTE